MKYFFIFVLILLFLTSHSPCQYALETTYSKNNQPLLSESLFKEAKELISDHLNFWQNKQFRGGWAGAYKLPQGEALNEKGKVVKDTVVLQHEATPAVALLFLTAYELLDEPSYLETAKAAGNLILELQLPHGGWAEEFKWNGPGWEVITPKDFQGEGILDDGVCQNSIILLAWLYRLSKDKSYENGMRKGLQYLLSAQHKRGSWPQAYPGTRTNLSGSKEAYSVLNDGATTFSAEILLWQSLREPSFKEGREAFFNCANWLLNAQKISHIPAWGLQYDRDDKLTWARPWEPPAISPSASRDAMEVLLTAYELSADTKYLTAVSQALSWFDKVKDNGGWVLFYDPMRGVSIRAKDYKIQDGIMEKEGYVSGQPADWGLSNIRLRYQQLKSGQSSLKADIPVDLNKAVNFLNELKKEKIKNGPLFRRYHNWQYVEAKDKRPGRLLELIEQLRGGKPYKNVLLRIEAALLPFPDVLHSQGR